MKNYNDVTAPYRSFGGLMDNGMKLDVSGQGKQETLEQTIKQQIIDAYKAGEKNMRETFSCSGYKNVSAEDYYNERVR